MYELPCADEVVLVMFAGDGNGWMDGSFIMWTHKQGHDLHTFMTEFIYVDISVFYTYI